MTLPADDCELAALIDAAYAPGGCIDPLRWRLLARDPRAAAAAQLRLREGLSGEQALARVDDANAAAVAAQAAVDAECLAARAQVRAAAAATWTACVAAMKANAAAEVNTLFAAARRARETAHRQWRPFGAQTAAQRRAWAAADEAAQWATAAYTVGSRAILAALTPGVSVELRQAADWRNTSARRAGLSGAVHAVVLAPFVIGRYRRAAGQTLAGRLARSFYDWTEDDGGPLAIGDARVAIALCVALARVPSFPDTLPGTGETSPPV